MAIRILRTENDEILRKPCRPVTDFNNEKLGILINDMIETMDKEDGIGLAAPQVGVLRRIFVIREQGKEARAFINPVLLTSEGEQEYAEACLSLPGKQGYVTRPAKVTVESQDVKGNRFTAEAEDILAVALCHEIDHLNGILYTDIASQMLTPEEMEELNKDD